MYNVRYECAYALPDTRRTTLVLMHILIQSPFPSMSTFSYKASDNAETHMQHSPLLLHSVEQEYQQNCNSHSSLLETLRDKWAGKEYYCSLRMAIHINREIRIPKWKNKATLNWPPIDPHYHWPISFVNFVCSSLVSAFVNISATFSFVCT